MRLRNLLLAASLLFMSLTNTPANAQGVDPCTVYTCMAGISGVGATGGPGCAPATEMFFSIVIFDPWFDGVATASARRTFLMTCPGAESAANAAILEAIITEWGAIP